MLGRDRIQYKSPDQVRAMRRAGLVVGQTLDLLRTTAAAGMTTRELNDLAERRIRGAGAVPSFLGYGHPPFSGTVCISVNDEIVHGAAGRPGARRRVTSSRSTAAPSSTAGTATRR